MCQVLFLQFIKKIFLTQCIDLKLLVDESGPDEAKSDNGKTSANPAATAAAAALPETVRSQFNFFFFFFFFFFFLLNYVIKLHVRVQQSKSPSLLPLPVQLPCHVRPLIQISKLNEFSCILLKTIIILNVALLKKL